MDVGNGIFVISIAGSDTSAGAGAQADLKTMAALGVHGLSVLTCVVTESPSEVRGIFPIPAEVVREQLEFLLSEYAVGVIKTGMLYSASQIRVTAEVLRGFGGHLVVDPVMVASTGDRLQEIEAGEVLEREILTKARVITPNLPEAEALLGQKIASGEELEAAGKLAENYDCAVYLKGGHRQVGEEHHDFLVWEGGERVFAHRHLKLGSSHGTGCTFGAALAAGLAKGCSVLEASEMARSFVQQALRRAYRSSGGRHLHLNQLPDQPA